MKLTVGLWGLAFLVAISSQVLGQGYSAPAGGWTYTLDGSNAAGGAGFTALDGSWSHDNGSDAWDESAIGAGSAGGVSSMDGFLRIQDTGDPRDYGMPDPGSNRKIYLGHDITAEGAAANILDAGVTLSFRTRLATTAPLDDARPDGGAGVVPWPAGGDGYVIHDGGKGNFSIKQANGGVVSFSLGDDGAGLLMNGLNGNAITGDVNTGQGTANALAANLTDWNEFWVTIQGGGAGTHLVDIYANGSLTPSSFEVTAGGGNDFGDIGYIAMGAGSTGNSGAFDVDFFSWAPGATAPVPEPSTGVLALLIAPLALAIRRRRAH